MRKILFFLVVLLPFIFYAGEYYNGYESLVSDDTLTTDASATDSVVVYTTFHEAFSDTLYFSFYLLAKETGAQVGNLDIDLAFSPDSSSGFSAYQALKANLDVGATCDDKWYNLPIGTNADALYGMKWMMVTIMNSDADANEVIIKDFGIAFKKEISH